MFVYLREGERGREREREKERTWERNIISLYGFERERERNIKVGEKHGSVTSWGGDRTCNLLVYGSTLQPNEPPGQDQTIF